MNAYRFIKEDGKWYIDLPVYLYQGGRKGDLQMVEGADTMLDIISGHKDEVALALDRNKFEGADKIELIERCDPLMGGAITCSILSRENSTITKCGCAR